MNVRSLKQFISISETGSISRSAKEQNISQPALTRSIKKLESDLDVELIERRSHGVFLTPAGEHLLEYARSIVNDTERAKYEIRAMKDGTRGKLSIGVGPSFTAGVLSKSLDKLLFSGEHLEVHLVEGFIEDLCADLRSGSLDVVLSLFPTNFDTSDLNFIPLGRVESVLAANSSHPLAGKKAITRNELAQYNWVIAHQKYVAATFREYLAGTIKPSKARHIRAGSISLIKSLVIESQYLTILPKVLIEPEIKAGRLVVLDGPVKPLVSEGGIASRKSGFCPTGLSNFIDILQRELKAFT